MTYSLNQCEVCFFEVAQLTVLRTHNAESAGPIPSLARTFNSFEKFLAL